MSVPGRPKPPQTALGRPRPLQAAPSRPNPPQTAIVKNLSSKFILGMDFMKLANININVPTEKISMDGNVISTGFFNNHESKCHTINSSGATGSCTSQQHVPAYSIAAIKVKTTVKGEEIYITHKNNPYDDLIIYDTIGKSNDQGIVKIFVGNKSAEDLKIGRGVEICSTIKTQSFQAPSINEIKTEAKTQAAKIPAPLQGKAAREFLETINLKCPPEQRLRYQKLFLEYHDVFSKNEYDLGWTDKVSHRINLEHKTTVRSIQNNLKFPFLIRKLSKSSSRKCWIKN